MLYCISNCVTYIIFMKDVWKFLSCSVCCVWFQYLSFCGVIYLMYVFVYHVREYSSVEMFSILTVY